VFAILVLVVVAHAVAATTVGQQNFLSRRRGRKATPRGDADVLPKAGKTTPKARGRRGGRERRLSRGKGKGKENPRESSFEASVRRARQKREREREREKKPFESAGGHAESAESRDCRFCGDVFPDKSIRRKEHHTRGARASFREII
jgi:hypothetical protein